MKSKCIIASLLCLTMLGASTVANARGEHHHNHNNSSNFATLLVGTAILGVTLDAMSHSNYYAAPRYTYKEYYPVYYQQPTYYVPQPIYYENTIVYQPPQERVVFEGSRSVAEYRTAPRSLVSNLPHGYRSITVDGVRYYENNGIFYQPINNGKYVMVPQPF